MTFSSCGWKVQTAWRWHSVTLYSMSVERGTVIHRPMAERYPQGATNSLLPTRPTTDRVGRPSTRPLFKALSPQCCGSQSQASKMWLLRGQTMSKATAGVTSVLRIGRFHRGQRPSTEVFSLGRYRESHRFNPKPTYRFMSPVCHFNLICKTF